LRNGLASLAGSARFRIGVSVWAGKIVRGPRCRFLGILARQHLWQPLLGSLTACNGVIALLLRVLPQAPLDGQFLLSPLVSLIAIQASDESRMVTGHVYLVDSGITIS
jgi:hypothetical protein